MRDRDDLEEQRWQPTASAAHRDQDPLAELARIVGQGGSKPPAAANAPAPASGADQQEWIDEIERAFADISGQAGADVAARAREPRGQEVPAWLRSPAVPQLPVTEGQPDPRLAPDAFTHDFAAALDDASTAPQPGYYAQDPYQLAANGGADAFGAAAYLDDGSTAPAPQPSAGYAHDAYANGAYGRDGVAAGDAGYDDFAAGHYASAPDAYDDTYDAQGAYGAANSGRRRKLVVAALALGLGALVVAGAFLFRGGGTVDGEPPVVTADGAPVKIEPETPGGAEVPNTNKAIYEHTSQTPSGEEAVVVDDREQPVDINQMIAQQNAAAEAEAAAQQAQSMPAAPTTTTAPPTGAAGVVLPEAPEPTSPAIASLGEPKRVRTVSVRPDGSILPSSAPSASEAPAAAAPTIEQLASATPAVTAPATPTVPAPEATESAATQGQAVAPTVGPVPRPASVNRPATRAPMQLGPLAISPQAPGSRVASAPAQPQAAAQPTAQPAAAGSFTVQLAAPGSENEARSLFATLQRRHGELAGYSPSIIRAESGGRTIYRLRVGAFPSRDAATALCVRIQAAGGQCFVARN